MPRAADAPNLLPGPLTFRLTRPLRILLTDPGKPSGPKCPPPRIGLALSGGGFRAALFHLGVIRRLEELGVMKHVQTISAVSGGAIIAAYYAVEMEKRLRKRADELSDDTSIDAVRLNIFDDIATCFFRGLDHNMRSRALVFMPFYHPVLFIKALFCPSFSRSDIMQQEYDEWFYRKATLDHLPSVTWSSPKGMSDAHPRTGPKVILNTTSLLNGERRSFAREPVVGLRELHRVNRNVIPISRVVGASSGVPGVFPPTVVNGDQLVDGGVSDNQGTDALIEEFTCQDRNQAGNTQDGRADVLLVSDASGQMEPVHRVRTRAFPVLNRTASILQFQLRKKTIRYLRCWENEDSTSKREFAFVHLLLNLKDRERSTPGDEKTQDYRDRSGHDGQIPRVPTEYIAPLSKIRTDLDQFNFIERECLMYHGYTLIDAQIRKHCCALKNWIECNSGQGGWPAYRRPPLFCERPEDHTDVEPCAGESRRRRRVQEVLRLGAKSLFLVRSVRRHWNEVWTCRTVAACLLLAVTIGMAACVLYRAITHLLCEITGWCDGTGAMPIWMGDYILIRGLVGAGLLVLVPYFVLWATFEDMREMVKEWDARDYRDLTSKDPRTNWCLRRSPGERDGS